MAAWARAAVGMFAVGWGANQFTSLLLAYRDEAGVSTAVGDALFGCYALGLIPVLLVGGPLSDRLGRRAMARIAVVTSLLATVVLVLGTENTAWLYLGRLLAGVASGAIFAPGTAWVKELSSPPHGAAAPDAGARRAAISLSAGFGLGPLVAGLISQWAPHPLVSPYLAHLVVIVVAGALVWRAPETVGTRQRSVWSRIGVRAALSPRFLGIVAPLAPWVFTAAAVSMTLGPALVADRVGSWPVAFAGVIAGVTLGTGVLVQPLARRIDGTGDARTASVGLGSCIAGAGVQAVTAATGLPVFAVVAGTLLGAGYGFCLVAGLLETQRIASPAELASLTAVYYALTYLGFAAPLVLAGLHAAVPYPGLLAAVAALAAITLVAVRRALRRTAAAPV